MNPFVYTELLAGIYLILLIVVLDVDNFISWLALKGVPLLAGVVIFIDASGRLGWIGN